MIGYVVRRLQQMVPVLFLVSVIAFMSIHLIPGDPVLIMGGSLVQNQPEVVEALRHQLGLDQPLYVQYLQWISKALRGDLGVSMWNQQPVTEIILQRLPATIELAFASMLMALAVAIPGGIIAGIRPDSLVDRLVTLFVTMGMAMPGFWLGIMLALLFAVRLKWLPPLGYVPFTEDPVQNLKHLVLPGTTLAIVIAAPMMRFLRSSLLEITRMDYITTARAKGLKERVVILRHALKNALIPFITVVGLQLAGILAGVVVIEWVFGWPGMGWLIVDTINRRNYSLLQSSVLLIAVVFLFVNLVVDILYAFLDPRIRYE